MYSGDDESTAIGVPLFYGLLEAVLLGVFCIIAWQVDWTKAPRRERLCVVLLTSYEIEDESNKFDAEDGIDLEAIEVEVVELDNFGGREGESGKDRLQTGDVEVRLSQIPYNREAKTIVVLAPSIHRQVSSLFDQAENGAIVLLTHHLSHCRTRHIIIIIVIIVMMNSASKHVRRSAAPRREGMTVNRNLL